jgi:CheY-like chemotaxis protein/MinD-like ATPase involved in chromosome partitioning or flagellar assembly
MPSVLVIDDEASLIAIVGRFLRKEGFRVLAATSGQEGLRKAVAESPDVVIVDIMMPEMDGYEVCRRLRADPRTARSRILVLTARSQRIDEQMAMQAGADDYIAKPFSGTVLVEQVQDLLHAMPQFGRSLGSQILILRLKGGIGATTLACNLGVCLAAEKGCLTVVADMVLPGGQIGERLGLPSSVSWLESTAQGAEGLVACTVRHSSGLFALPAPPALRSSTVTPSVTSDLLQRLRGWYDFVVLDTPLNLSGLAPVLLGSSWLVLLLLVPDPGALRAARASLVALRRLSRRGLQVWPVLNMVDSDPSGVQRQVEQALGLRVAAVLPWSPRECSRAVSDHTPEVLSCPESLLARRLRVLSRRAVRATDTRVYQRSRI